MEYYEKTNVSEDIDINKASASNRDENKAHINLQKFFLFYYL